MFLTNVLLKKAKSKYIMVALQSTCSPHKLVSFRERVDDKKEIIHFDPLVGMECVYKEQRKIRSMKKELTLTKQWNEDTYGTVLK